MKRKLLTTILILAASVGLAPSKSEAHGEKYWFYVYTLPYGKATRLSPVMQCSQAVTTPGFYTKADAVGPFSSFSDAHEHRKEVRASISGKIITKTAVCDPRWD